MATISERPAPVVRTFQRRSVSVYGKLRIYVDATDWQPSLRSQEAMMRCYHYPTATLCLNLVQMISALQKRRPVCRCRSSA
jgi:hypothetical protein